MLSTNNQETEDRKPRKASQRGKQRVDSRSYLVVDRNNTLVLSPSTDHSIIEPENTSASIGIKKIRDLKSWAKMKPFQTTLKVVLIKQAQNLTVEAQNAMLKILEEPPRATVIVLTVNDTKNLLPTIISRCTQMTNEQMTNDKWKKVFSISSSIPSFPSTPSFPKEITECFAFAENLASQGREIITKTLSDWIKSLHKKLHQEENFGSIPQQIREIEKTRRAILKNVNARLALENLMLKLA